MSETKIIPEWGPDDQADLLACPNVFNSMMRPGLTPEILEKLREEKSAPHILPGGEQPKELMGRLTELGRLRSDVGTDAIKCPACKGTLQVYKLSRGQATGVEVLWPVPCPCRLYRDYYKVWHNPDFIAKAYRNFTYKALLDGELAKYFRVNETCYKTILAVTKQLPRANRLLTGSAGTGKTTLLSAVFEGALARWAADSFERQSVTPAVWKVNAPTLAEQFRVEQMLTELKDENVDIERPLVSEAKVRVAVKWGLTPHVAIDEFDKIKFSPFQLGAFGKLIDACQANKGFVAVSSNLNFHQLRIQLGEQHGEPILRRLIGVPQGIYINFDEGKVYVNNVRVTLQEDGSLVPRWNEKLFDKFGTPEEEEMCALLGIRPRRKNAELPASVPEELPAPEQAEAVEAPVQVEAPPVRTYQPRPSGNKPKQMRKFGKPIGTGINSTRGQGE